MVKRENSNEIGMVSWPTCDRLNYGLLMVMMKCEELI